MTILSFTVFSIWPPSIFGAHCCLVHLSLLAFSLRLQLSQTHSPICFQNIPPSTFFYFEKNRSQHLVGMINETGDNLQILMPMMIVFQMKENIRERLSCVNKPCTVWLDWLSFSKHDDWVDFTHMIHLLLILTIMQQ